MTSLHSTELIKMSAIFPTRLNTPLPFKHYNSMLCDIIDASYTNLLRLAVEYDLGNISDEVYNMLQQKEFTLLTEWIKNA